MVCNPSLPMMHSVYSDACSGRSVLTRDFLGYFSLHFELNYLCIIGLSSDQKPHIYVLQATHFGNYEKNREGFEKLFHKLSDSTWDDAIDLIKYITKRGGVMNFSARKSTQEPAAERTHELYELHALARGLDTQKKLAEEALAIHGEVTRHHEEYHDPEVGSYLEEHFMHRQAKTVRDLAGYTSDLEKLLVEKTQTSLSLFLFDEYLQKAL